MTPLTAEETELAKRLWSVLIAENQRLRRSENITHARMDIGNLLAVLDAHLESTDTELEADDAAVVEVIRERNWQTTPNTVEPPPEVHALQTALAQAIAQGCTCDHLYGATCNIHRLENPAGIQEAVDHLKALEDAARFMRDFLAQLEGDDEGDPLKALRLSFHKPLHAKLDAALKGVRNV